MILCTSICIKRFAQNFTPRLFLQHQTLIPKLKYLPQHKALRKHIDHYWIIEDVPSLFHSFQAIYAYPGIRPELIMPLKGKLTFHYLGKKQVTQKSMMFSHIEGNFLFYPNQLQLFVIVQFKPCSLAAVQPFVKLSGPDLMKRCVCDADVVFGESINRLANHLKKMPPKQIAVELDDWFFKKLDEGREGFITEIFNELTGDNSLQKVREATKYSYSTLERYFKKETGMTPKKFQSLRRYKQVVEEIYDSQNKDWIHYVEKYGYYDQSHFIKEIKRYTHFTPAQLLQLPALRTYRPLKS